MTNNERRRIVTGDEQDVHTTWRHFISVYSKAGKAAAVKRETRRRERREYKTQLREEPRD
jgi:hypothetical protein